MRQTENKMRAYALKKWNGVGIFLQIAELNSTIFQNIWAQSKGLFKINVEYVSCTMQVSYDKCTKFFLSIIIY